MSLKHRKVVNVADDPAAAAKLRPSDWGSPYTDYGTAPTHVFDGGALGSLAMRDTGAVDGFSWLPSTAGVLVSAGSDQAPVFRALLPADIPALSYEPVFGTLGVAKGGTGLASFTVGDLVYASGVTALSKLAAVATGSVLVSGGVGAAPAWSATPTLTSLTLSSGRVSLPDATSLKIGYQALQNEGSSGTYYVAGANIAIGYEAGKNTTNGRVLAIGYRAGKASTGDGVLTAVGWMAGSATTSGHATFFGNGAGKSNTTSNSVAVGDESAGLNTTGFITAVGYYAGYSNVDGFVTALGYEAGRFVGTSAWATLVGYRAGSVVTGVGATAVGHDSAFSTTSGLVTTVGYQAGRANITGHLTAVGYEALKAATTNSSAVGYRAGYSNVGGFVTALGYQAGYSNTTGVTTAIGYNAAFENVGNMIAIGHQAGLGNVSANKPLTDTGAILIGDFASRSVASATSLSNYVGIGDGVLVSKSNQVVLGNTSITETVLRGYVEMVEIADPAAPAANTARLYFRDNGAGKTQLVVRFPTGAIQVIATEP